VLVSGNLRTLWSYIVGPQVGRPLAVALAWTLRSPGSPRPASRPMAPRTMVPRRSGE
jgi:hypothetical protein